jgi:hypothetical protein
MSTLQGPAALTDATANLIAQLHELNELREQVRKAELSAGRSKIAADRSMDENNLQQRKTAPSVSAHR